MMRREFFTEESGPDAAARSKRTTTPQRRSEKPAETSAMPLFSRYLSDQMLAKIRKDFPGWDGYALKGEFDAWVGEKATRAPKNYDAASYGFVRRHTAGNQE
jgi:hypothetical protein